MASLLQLLFLSALLSIACGGARERISAEHGVVATDHGLCSSIGRDVLKEGGHAVDAAVAAALCLGVVSPASSGIGGGAFMLVHSAGGETDAYDMRETAPKRASKDMYAGNATLKASGPLSVAVPGELAGLTLALLAHVEFYKILSKMDSRDITASQEILSIPTSQHLMSDIRASQEILLF